MTENNTLYTPNCIRTYSGQFINVGRMDVTQVFPIDIAYGLARECRFGNHTTKFYSVADHSVWCMLKGKELYPDDKALHFRLLMHDAHEAYLGDWCTPLIDAIDLLYPGVKQGVTITKRIVQATINSRFGITTNPLDCPKVKEIDKMALEYEWSRKVLKWSGMKPMDDEGSANYFLTYFKELAPVPHVIKP